MPSGRRKAITNGGEFARRLGFAVVVTGIKRPPASFVAISRAGWTSPLATFFE